MFLIKKGNVLVLSACCDPARTSINEVIVDVPSCKTARRISVNEFHINSLWNIEIFIYIAVCETHFKYLLMIFIINNHRRCCGYSIFGKRLIAGFRSNANQEMIGFYDRFALCFGFMLSVRGIREFIGMPDFHQRSIN